MIRRKDVLMEDDRYLGKTVSVVMPHTKEKHFKCNATNNNDHNYLHKKFKKMASTVSAPPQSHKNESNVSYKDLNVAQSATHSSISNGSISAAHPEIEKVKNTWLENLQPGKDVQINFSEDNHKLNELHVNITGQTSTSDEFSLKTDNNDNDFTKDVQSSGSGGRYICPYCKLSCAKPSVLQKHIRAHTNERPYPCVPCGFAFKTKSNLYKHRRSRTHALRLQGNDMSSSPLEEDWSAGSESDNSLPPASTSDHFDGMNVSLDINRPSEFSSPELNNDCPTPPYITGPTTNDNNKLKSIYKPKFRAAFYLDQDDRQRKPFSPNADFLNEHISKIISDNEAIVDVIETPLQKKYGKIKQIAESKQLNANFDNKSEFIALNLTKNRDSDNSFRKRSHSESFSINNQKHPLNPEGSIIKDLLLKTKASNGLTSITAEMLDGISPPYICPLCQIPYRSADNLEVHRTYYCKGLTNIHSVKDIKTFKFDNANFIRSNSINVKFPEMGTLSNLPTSPPLRTNKPENLVIIKPEATEIAAPLPSPGPLLGNTRLVDSRVPADNFRKTEPLKSLPLHSPKRRIERNDNFSPRHMDNTSPRSVDMYLQPKMRCLEHNTTTLSQFDEYSNNRPNSNSLQMFGGEVKILDYSGGTTTLRIEPSKNHLSPILIQSNMSPSKLGTESEASSVVVRSGLHSGGTIVHNIPTPKDTTTTPKSQSSRLHSTHFQFPPLSAITAFNPLTLPLRPSLSPNGTSSILHGGKIIPHVPGMPGPNTSDLYMGNPNLLHQKTSQDGPTANTEMHKEVIITSAQTKAAIISKLDGHITRNDILRSRSNLEFEKSKLNYTNTTIVPVIKVDETCNSNNKPNISKVPYGRLEANIKKTVDAPLKIITKDCHDKFVDKMNVNIVAKNIDNKTSNDIRQFNFENLITKAEIYNNQLSNSEINKNILRDCSEKSNRHERSDTLYFQKNCTTKGALDDRKAKFLRPSTLPLKPGTFTPKRHHGITPNANTMPLVSPETPRPSKAYGQLYLNGNAYTYLGLKCSTKVFYCTINRPQPTYVPNQHFLSMYSNWQLLSELTPDPLGLSASSAMSLYDSRHRPQNITTATLKHDLILTHSSQWKENKQESTDIKNYDDDKNLTDNNVLPKKELTGGFESNEEYTYVRGRGRGRYVCSECGIRCKKPSMLKKHIRTHTDVRPYTCTHCAFSFKTKGNLTKHMKSKAHYKKCCELGINPNEGNEMDVGENTQGSGETDEETDSDGDDGNEGETESSDTETCKSRLPEHEAAHCLLSLGGTRLASATPCFLTSARPSTYPYTPTGVDITPTDQLSDKGIIYHVNDDNKMDVDNEPMDLSRSDIKTAAHVTEIPTAHESSVLASLASNTAKLPHHQNQWTNGEPMLHAYLTERALLDSKIKQSQLTSNLSKLRQNESDEALFKEKNNITNETANKRITTNIENNTLTSTTVKELATTRIAQLKPVIKKEITKTVNNIVIGNIEESKISRLQQNDITHNTENAKFVVSEYLKHAKVNALSENHQFHKDNFIDNPINTVEDSGKLDESSSSDNDSKKMHVINHDLVAQKVVIGAGGVAFKVSKGKEFEPNPSYAPGKLMEDGRKVCDFCNKTFTKPSQLKIHLNIHYMERPFKCSACAVSFRTRGHLQKHERSGSHHNKVSMTSTFGAATSLNPRPFRCSDCNIAFRIHGHLAKHLRSKMHVMKLECLFKLPFGTFTEIERAGVSLTDIDTTDCASSLSSLQVLAQKLHEKDPTKLEYRDPSTMGAPPSGKESSEDEDGICDRVSESDSDVRTTSENITNDSRIIYSATDS